MTDTDLLKEKQDLSSIRDRLSTFIDIVDNTWLFQSSEWKGKTSYQFNPTWIPASLTNHYLLRHAKQFVFMSATFPPLSIISKTLGIPLNKLDYLEVASEFPADNRRVILMPMGDLSYRFYNNSIRSILKGVQVIMNQHPNDKGIIHTVSWKLNKDIMSIGSFRFITHNSKNKVERFEQFLNSDFPAIFVSPSSTRGIDLPDDLCRFSIIPKAPFLSLADKLVKMRLYGSGKTGKEWYISDAAQNMVQASGRMVRHFTDYGTTYILDRRAIDLVVDNPGLFAVWWRDGIELMGKDGN